MAARDIVLALPEELALRIFTFFTYTELLPVAATCRGWRQMAIDCPVYWSGTMLSAPTDGEAQTLAIRLTRANGRPCAVHTHTPLPWDTLTNTILPVLRANIHSISWLNIYVHVSQSEEVLRLLEMPGWQLHALEVSFVLDSMDTPLPVLPHNLLGRDAPRLRMLWLENVQLPESSPAVLESVAVVAIGYYPPERRTREVPDLWFYFPNMRQLTLAGDAVLGEDVASATHWDQLEWLRLQISATGLDYVFEHTPAQIARVPNVQIQCSTPELVDALVQHVKGPLQIALHQPSDAEGSVRIHLGDEAWSRSRGFLTNADDWTDDSDPPCDLFSREDIVERVVSLTVPDILWHAVTRDMSSLPNLAELRLVLDHESAVKYPQLRDIGKLICPALKRLILRVDSGEYYVTLGEVQSFALDALLGSWRLPLELQFENVTLIGHGRSTPDDDYFTYSLPASNGRWNSSWHFQLNRRAFLRV